MVFYRFQIKILMMNRSTNAYPSLPQAWIIFVIFLAASIVMGLGVMVFNELAGTENLSAGNFIAYNLSMVFVIWFAWRNRTAKGERALYFRRPSGWLLTLLVSLTLSLSVTMDPLTNLIPMPDLIKEVFAMLAARDVWTFAMVCLTGPVLEEVLFRGMILDGLLHRYRPGKAIFWSAFLFGLFHLNPWQFIPGFLVGLLLGYIYLRTRSLIPVILVHMVNNSLSYIIMYIYGPDVLSFRELFAKAGQYYIFFALSSVIFVLCLFLLHKRLTKHSETWTFNSKTGSLS